VADDSQGQSNAYRAAGVDIDLAHALLDRVKGKIASTRQPGALAPIGGFGGMFRIDLTKYRRPVMVQSVDSVGTKVLVALLMDKHDTVGHDIVNHCINDIAVQGAEPVTFLDYIGIGSLRSPLYEHVLEGVADACAAQDVTVIGGETAEMAGMYGEDYDLVGCITGIVEEDQIISGDLIRPGHVAIGLASSGLHTNGFSLARKVLFETCGYSVDTDLDALGETVGEALLHPHVCYWQAIKAALAEKLPLHGIAHITGGGLYDNIPRVLPEGTAVEIEAGALPVLPIFQAIQAGGNVDPSEMYRVFNMGVGMVWFVPEEAAETGLGFCTAAGFDAAVVGRVVAGDQRVTIHGLG
jgi:phosphoribosylformylglycinamidine cyclo-ligase